MGQLKRNNRRDWFADNKAIYETDIKKPAAEFAAELSRCLSDMTGFEHRSKVFRIHRDVRFSKDKTPYNSHLHIGFTPICDASTPPMWFFGVDPDKLTVGCGNMGFDKATLDRYREAVASTSGKDIEKAISSLVDKGFRIGEPELKRVPSPFDKDHERAELLRRKGVSIWSDFDRPDIIESEDIVARCESALKETLPVFNWLMKL